MSLLQLNKVPLILESIEASERLAQFLAADLNLPLDESRLRFIRSVMVYVLSGHWIACLWFRLGLHAYDLYGDSWLSTYKMLAVDGFGTLSEIPTSRRYVRSLHFAIGSITTVFYGDVVSMNVVETVVEIAFIVLCILIFGVLVGAQGELIEANYKHKMLFEQNLMELYHFLKNNSVPRDVRQRLRLYYTNTWLKYHGHDDLEGVRGLSSLLVEDIAQYTLRGFANKVSILKSCDESFLRSLLTCLKHIICSSSEAVVRKGDVDRSMYFIARGKVLVQGPGFELVKHEGDFFGELSLLYGIPRSATCSSLGVSLLYVLEWETYEKLLADYPEYREQNRREWVIVSTVLKTGESRFRSIIDIVAHMEKANWVLVDEIIRKAKSLNPTMLRTSAARVLRRSFSSGSELKKTPLYDLHVSLGGKMVPFAGYSMPVQYSAGVLQSHLHTREQGKASLFDVSHMGQLRITGKDRMQFLESVVVGDLQALGSGEAKLSLITNNQGGIIDDCVVSRYDDHLYVVVNAGNQDVDLVHMHKLLEGFKGDAAIERIQDRALVALQGTGAVDVVETLAPNVNLKDLGFMHGVFTPLKLKGGKTVDVILTRCGYTGEDGFEISVLSKESETFARALLDDERVLEAGLGARDSLRLEAGLCLHGHDITAETTPVEATLAWTIGKRRREEGGFPGHAIIMDQLKNKTATKKRVGFVVEGAAAREGAELYDAEDNVVGHVTSGTFSPSLKKAIGMAYVDKKIGKVGTELHVKARKKMQKATIAKMPFVPARYYKKE
ncbi:hypothetical protein G195_001257 [Phytophthora kernoviae 00238/432]|uniref:aminomethyltransferase n=1 Tax=Phytophthora kernoviae 00238/432 TaxID=1284355 RepID=A0A8J4WBJ8_9STRA|nr:hypothetical protein G195_001257 [Phytophthora kernoviae 00238/432]